MWELRDSWKTAERLLRDCWETAERVLRDCSKIEWWLSEEVTDGRTEIQSISWALEGSGKINFNVEREVFIDYTSPLKGAITPMSLEQIWKFLCLKSSPTPCVEICKLSKSLDSNWWTSVIFCDFVVSMGHPSLY